MKSSTNRSIAWEYYRSGRWQDAEERCRQAIESDPNDADAWHLLGKITRQTNRPDLAIECLRKALELEPDLAAAQHALGLVLDQQGKAVEAEACYRQAVNLQPDFAEAHFSLGSVLVRQEQPAAAEVELRAALALNPGHAGAHFRLGMALQSLGKLEQAAEEYQECIRLKPGLVEAHVNLGNVLRDQGTTEEAAASYLRAIHLQPDCALAHNNLGLLYLENGQLGQAEAALRQSLHYQPRSAQALYNLGTVFWRQGRTDEALDSYHRALHEKPDFVDAQLDLGNVYKELGRLDDAIATYRDALDRNPDAARVHSNLVQTLNYHPAFDAKRILEECRRWDEQHAQPLAKWIQPHRNDPQPERRLRVGYVSSDFRDHVDSFFTIPLFAHHDHRKFEVFFYSGVTRPDDITERIRGYGDCWRSTVGLSDQELFELIRADVIDILVDLKMHGRENRLRVFARKPAPVQVAWLGYPGTTGLKAMDYRLTDPHIDPPGQFDDCYSETSIRLPETFWCYDPLTDGLPVGPLPAERDGFVTFGCLNSFTKVNDGCLSLWAQVLKAVPSARFLLRTPRGVAREQTMQKLERLGIVASRLELTNSRSRTDYLKLYNRIDIGLDPSPYNGHTTSLDAFWMGVPTISLVGNTAVGRGGLSQLCNLALEQLVAKTPEEYVARATQLANDWPRLAELRSNVRERMRQSPLMDGNRFARHVESVYRELWRRWCRQHRF